MPLENLISVGVLSNHKVEFLLQLTQCKIKILVCNNTNVSGDVPPRPPMKLNHWRILKSVVLFYIVILMYIVRKLDKSFKRNGEVDEEFYKDYPTTAGTSFSRVLNNFVPTTTSKINNVHEKVIVVGNFTLRLDESEIHSGHLKQIWRTIKDLNSKQEILNEDKFDLSASSMTAVLVVQVHNRPKYLQYLIDTLHEAKFIDKTLLIFSHDYYSEELNNLVRSIDFCPVMQIFFPFSTQLFRDTFPGTSPKDCPKNTSKTEAKTLNCTSSVGQDHNGMFRVANLSQIKHHWFWKVNHIFEHLRVTKFYNGPVLFLEEDYVVAPDIIHMLLEMYKSSARLCSSCMAFTLGGYVKTMRNKAIFTYVKIMIWRSNWHNIGFSFNRTTWEVLKKCSSVFCEHDDYNWDWSLQYMFNSCVPGDLTAMIAKSPRVKHIGRCGVHRKSTANCNVAPLVKSMRKQFTEATAKKYLFPSRLSVIYYNVSARHSWPNGGWGDVRDKALCKHFVHDAFH